MNDKISVIVPIYNVEKYLPKCVDSIINQTYKNLEIILVDDGSQDNSGIICDDYAKKDNRVKVIHKKNGGASDSRNKGIEVSTGNFISFIDSDDWIELNMFEKLMNNLIKFSADMSYCGNNDVREYNNSLEIIKTTESDNIIDEKISKYEAVKRIYSRPFVLWGAIYKKYIFDDIRMPVGEIGEDEAIATDILDKCNIISYTNSAMYNYRIRLDGNSVTTSGFSEAYFSWPKHCKHNLDYIKEHYSDLISLAEKKYYMGIVLCLNGASENFKRYEIQTKKLILLLRKNILSILSNSYISIKEKICILLIIFNYRFYVFIIKRLGKKYM